jgi:hypothetical protein
MAVISFEFIEKPFRGGGSLVTRRQIFLLALTGSMLSGALGFVISYHRGSPARYDDRTRQLVLQNSGRKNDYQEVCTNWKEALHSLADINFCIMEPDSSGKIMFLGDSHVQQLYPVIKKLYDDGEFKNQGIVLALANGCPPTEHLNTVGRGYHCDSFARYAMVRAEQDNVTTVFMGFNTWWSVHEDVCPSVDGACVGKISVEESIPDLEIRNAVFARFGLAGVARDITLPRMRDQVASVARSAGADIFDPRESLCYKQNCITQVNWRVDLQGR